MKKKNNFEKKFPLFAKYITDANMQINMAENADLVRKYNACSESIEVFLKELDRRFDVEMIKRVIVEAIIKMPDSMMSSLITSYLNSSEEAKSNSEFLYYYNQVSSMGIASVQYVEKNGLITNRGFRDIPEKAIDAMFKDLRSGAEHFKGEELDEVYRELSYQEKQFVVSLLRGKIVDEFDTLFEKLNFSFKVLIKTFMSLGIDSIILNKDVVAGLSADYLLALVCLIIENGGVATSLVNTKKLLIAERYELIKLVINENLLSSLEVMDYQDLDGKSDEEVMENLRKKELVLAKQEN